MRVRTRRARSAISSSRVGHATMRRSVGTPPCSVLSVMPYMSSTYSLDAHPELVQVEVRVPGDERIERPIDDVAAELANELSLLLLEPASEADVPRLGAHGEHVGPVDDAPSLDAGESEDESDEVPVRPESAEDDAADALSDFKEARGNDVAETLAPGLAL